MGTVRPPGYKRKRNFLAVWNCNNCGTRNFISRVTCSGCTKKRTIEVTR